MRNIDELREKIDYIDKKMAELFVRRMRFSKWVMKYKKKNKLPIYDPTREKEVLEKNCAAYPKAETLDYYRDFVNYVMDLSKEYQYDLLHVSKIGYQGIEGSFGHNVAIKRFNHDRLKYYSTFEDVVTAIEKEKLTYGILPLENSYAGDVNEVFDLLFHHDVFINEIYPLKVTQNLLVTKDAGVEDVSCVLSHPQAVKQCMELIKDQQYRIVYTANTAVAAKVVSRLSDPTIGAIASIEAAERYNLKVLAKNINTDSDNQTKFAIVSKFLPKKGNRFAIMFSVDKGSGTLAIALNEIAKFNMEMKAIKSRATKLVPWQYYFYVEIIGQWYDPNSLRMIESLQTICKSLKLVGTFEEE